MAGETSTSGWRLPPDWVWRVVVFLIALALLVLIATRWNRWEVNADEQSTDDAYLQADMTRVAAKVSGYVRSMPVEDYERVRAGQVLVQLVDDDYKATVDQLTASVGAAGATIEAVKAVYQKICWATLPWLSAGSDW